MARSVELPYSIKPGYSFPVAFQKVVNAFADAFNGERTKERDDDHHLERFTGIRTKRF